MNDDLLVNLGLELCQEFQQWSYSLIDNWMNNIESLEQDWQPLEELGIVFEDVSQMSDSFIDWETWLTDDFAPSVALEKDEDMSYLARDNSPFTNYSKKNSFSQKRVSENEQTNLNKATTNPQNNYQTPSIYTGNKSPKSFKELANYQNLTLESEIETSNNRLSLSKFSSEEIENIEQRNLNQATKQTENNHQTPSIYTENKSPKSLKELANLVNNLPGQNLTLESGIETSNNRLFLNNFSSEENENIEQRNLNQLTTSPQKNHQITPIYTENKSPKSLKKLANLVNNLPGQNLTLESEIETSNNRLSLNNFSSEENENIEQTNLNQGTKNPENNYQNTSIYTGNKSPKSLKDLANLVNNLPGQNLTLESEMETSNNRLSWENFSLQEIEKLEQTNLNPEIEDSNNSFLGESQLTKNVKEWQTKLILSKTELEIDQQQTGENSVNQQHSFQEIEHQEIELDYILEALQREINQEYRRFYGG
jgi:hypothetical protein